ncbi:MAG: NAD(P)-dependent alcohol dehydrogenase [Acidobacteria bacterium]|nr:NAD(P)-dependent alcohol dehydrogenase [Acidobacteriota bacterium]
MKQTKAYAAASASSPLKLNHIQRRTLTSSDVAIDVLFCGVCHSDLHTVRDEWSSIMPTTYPCVPGHEIVGKVVGVGSEVTAVKVGDTVGVGCLVDSDQACPMCHAHVEQFCGHAVFTYNSPDKHLGGVTYGGYSEYMVVDHRFVLRVPDHLDLAGAAPLLCAGITTYSPMRRWGNLQGKRVGVVGLGGLGHMGVKFARAFGADVTVFTTSSSKLEDAIRLGAHHVVLSSDADAMKQHAFSFDFVLDTISADHDLNSYIQLLILDGTLTLVGAPENPMPVSSFGLLFGRKNVNGSLIGGIKETQEMLDFCGQHNITADVEVIPIQKINEAYERLLKSDVKYRFSIYMASLREN